MGALMRMLSEFPTKLASGYVLAFLLLGGTALLTVHQVVRSNAEREGVDLVLLDVEMPVMDGPAMAYQMFLHNLGLEGIPVLLISGVPELVRIAKEVGTPYFVSKPFKYERLIAAVTRALSERIPPLRQPASPTGAKSSLG